jgi:hypothetical protein
MAFHSMLRLNNYQIFNKYSVPWIVVSIVRVSSGIHITSAFEKEGTVFFLNKTET